MAATVPPATIGPGSRSTQSTAWCLRPLTAFVGVSYARRSTPAPRLIVEDHQVALECLLDRRDFRREPLVVERDGDRGKGRQRARIEEGNTAGDGWVAHV